MCVQSIREKNHLFRFKLLQIRRTDGHHLWEHLFQRFGPLLSSNVVRYACIVYIMYKQQKHTKEPSAVIPSSFICASDSERYVSLFYHAARQAINHGEYADLAYGSFAICLHRLRIGDDFQEVANHANGFRASVKQLMETSPPSGEEAFLLECLWEKLIWIMGGKMLFKTAPTASELETLKTFACPLFLSSYKAQPQWIQESFRIVILKFHFFQIIVALESDATPNSSILKAALVTRFLEWCKVLCSRQSQGKVEALCDNDLLRR